ncbi:MAG: ADOP family duplicated permease [Candidatus Acidiferrales bacterium]
MRPEHWLYTIPLRFRSLFRRKQSDHDLDAELRDHLEQKIEDYVSKGLAPAEARRQALLDLRGIEQTKEACRDTRRVTWLQDFAQDLRFGLRMLRKSPGFTAVAVLTLALGVGVNTTIFTIFNGFLLRPLPVPHAEQIVVVAVQEKGFPVGVRGFSYPEFVDVRRQLRSAADIFANRISSSEMTVNGNTEYCAVTFVSANFFTALHIKPALGQFIPPNQAEETGVHPILVLGYGYWQRRFGGAPVLGKRVLVDGMSATIVGIVPKSFQGMFSIFTTDAYLPMGALAAQDSNFMTSRDERGLLAFGRLRDGVPVRRAQTEIDVIAARLAKQYPQTDGTFSFRVIPEPLARPQPYANSYFLMAGGLFLGLAVFVFLLACINVENLLLTRTIARQRELGIRAALGARRSRLVGQMIAENLIFAILGALAGSGLGCLGNRLASSMHIHNFPLQLDVTFDWRVFGYVSLLAAAAAIAVTLFPALRASRSDVNTVLHGHHPDAGVFGNTFRGRNLLVVAQIAGSMALLVIAVLLVQSLRHARNLNLGFDPRQVLNATFDPSNSGYDQTRAVSFYRELESRVSELPGVQSVSLASNVPMAPSPCKRGVYVQNRPLPPGQSPPNVLCNYIDGPYFATMRIPLLRGRTFAPSDDEHSAPVAIINETMARSYWPHQDPLGKSFSVTGPNGPWVQIVGVAANGKYLTVMEDPQPSLYLPLDQNFTAKRTLLVRSFGEPESMAGPIERAAAAFAPGLPPLDIETMQHALEGAFGFFIVQLGATLAGIMGGVGLTLALVGVYGVVSFALAQRTREFGIRLALGATPKEIMRLVLRQGSALAIFGALVGFLLTRVLSKTFAHVLFGVSSTDPITYCAVAVVLVAIVLLACAVPARRAMRVDPMVTLRYE